MAQEQPKTAEGQWTASAPNYLVTPPEDNMDSFSQGDEDEAPQTKAWTQDLRGTLPPIQHRTPPASPATNTLPSISTATGFSRDVTLFPGRSQSEQEHSQVPLFEIEEPRPKPSPIEPPALGYPACLGIETAQEAREYWEDRMDEVRRLRDARRTLPVPWVSSGNLRDRESEQQLHSLTRSSGISKTRGQVKTASRPTPKPKAAVAASPAKVSPPKPRRSPKPKSYPQFLDTAFASGAQQTKHKRAAPSKKTEGDVAHWSELPDFAPPITDLDTNPKALKVSWTGTLVPLTDDPDRKHMHPQELSIATTLRLTCASYLYNKRKIFQAKVQALKDGKGFTKTAAQSTCHIDVNKASQLWEAFDRIGWFNRSWFEQHV